MKKALLLVFMAALAAAGLRAQDSAAPAYFKEEAPPWWKPAYAITLTSEHIRLGDDDPPNFIDRTRGSLRLRWGLGAEGEVLHLDAGVVGYMGSDSNIHNLPWQDNERSNGMVLDVADLRARWLKSAGGLELHGGLLENPLISSESLWDADLRIIGASGKAFLRTENGLITEAGVRGVAGEVRLLDHGRVKLRAVQAVLKVETGPVAWFAHAGRWTMDARQEDAAHFLRSNPGPGGYVRPDLGSAYEEPHFDLNVYGGGLSVEQGIPFELKVLRAQNREYRDRGDELQAWIGSRTRVWWPQFGYIRQRLDASGALASVNGDRWWFHAYADGQRYVLALNLPGHWRAQLDRIVQRGRESTGPIERTGLSLIKRF